MTGGIPETERVILNIAANDANRMGRQNALIACLYSAFPVHGVQAGLYSFFSRLASRISGIGKVEKQRNSIVYNCRFNGYEDIDAKGQSRFVRNRFGRLLAPVQRAEEAYGGKNSD